MGNIIFKDNYIGGCCGRGRILGGVFCLLYVLMTESDYLIFLQTFVTYSRSGAE